MNEAEIQADKNCLRTFNNLELLNRDSTFFLNLHAFDKYLPASRSRRSQYNWYILGSGRAKQSLGQSCPKADATVK